jgi:hypothetical protein
MNRRQCFGYSLVWFPLLAKAQSSLVRAGDPDLIADEWMLKFQSSVDQSKPLKGGFDVRRIQGRVYILLSPISWKGLDGSPIRPVTAPRGFVSDLASVPRVFWTIFEPAGDYAYAAVLHDYLYWTQDRGKPESDQIFRLAMNDLKIKDWQAESLFSAVSLFGQGAWDRNRKLKESGERRILIKLPDDPTVNWDDWKRRPDVF